MTAIELIDIMATENVQIALTKNDKLRVTGDQERVAVWLLVISQHEEALVAALQADEHQHEGER